MTVIDTGPLDGGNLDESTTAEHIHGICLKTGPPRRVGVELEWLVRDMRDPSLPVPAGRTAGAVSAFGAAAALSDSKAANDSTALNDSTVFNDSTALSDSTAISLGTVFSAGTGYGASGGQGNGAHGEHTGSRGRPNGDHRSAGGTAAELPTSAHPGRMPSGALLTAEPGGQLEISSLPAASLADLVQATCADLAALRAALAADGLELAGTGLDPLRPPRRVLDLPRYAAMESYFDSGGPWGRRMMGGTASVQVCLDAGEDSDGPGGYRWRWRLLHAIGPVLVAAFANSPLREGKPTGWASSRQQVWTHMDPGRTRPPRLDADPRAAWTDYALDARLMCLRNPGAADWAAPPGLTLREWARAGRPRRPAADDVDLHLSTLFPPVRPRGHFELRMIDAQPGNDGWVVPLAVCWALLADERAGDAALAAVAPLWDGDPDDTGPWLRAARLGPADPATGTASRGCFAAAREALDRAAVPASITACVDAFMDDYVSKDRCPADDLLEETQ